MLGPFWYGVYCGAFLMIVLWAVWQCARAVAMERARDNWLAEIRGASGDPRVLRYIANSFPLMTEQEFYRLPLPEQRRRLGLREGQNPGPPSYGHGFTELELDSMLMRKPNGGLG